MNEKNKDILIEDAYLMPGPFRNFSGAKTKYNAEGDKNFCVKLPPELVEPMMSSGWNVRPTQPFHNGDPVEYYIQVKVNYNSEYPPKVVRILSATGRATLLNKDTVCQLDHDVVLKADVLIHPYIWEVNGATGIKAYLKTAYFTVLEDVLEAKYAGILDEEEYTEE